MVQSAGRQEPRMSNHSLSLSTPVSLSLSLSLSLWRVPTLSAPMQFLVCTVK